jgi:hypothetical protein
VAFLADLLSVSASERHPLPNLSPQRKKTQTREALIPQLEGLARQQPVDEREQRTILVIGRAEIAQANRETPVTEQPARR